MDPARKVLYGRRDEQRVLADLITATGRGRPAVLTLVGGPGLGKSALLDWVDDEASSRSYTVLRSCGYDTDAHAAHAGLLGLLHPLRTLIDSLEARQAATLRSALALSDEAPVGRYAVAAATLSLLAAAAERSATICLIDDAHWMDRASLEAITFATRRLGVDRIGFVFASREVLDQPRGNVIRLRGLDRAAALAVVRSHHTDLDESDAERIITSAAGVPLDLIWSSSMSTLTAPPRVGESFFERAEILSEDDLLAALIVALDSEASASVTRSAMQAAGLTEACLDAAESSGLIQRDHNSIVVNHPLARSAIVARGTGEMTRSAHRALAAAEGGASVERATWHLAAAAIGPDDDIAAEIAAIGADGARRGDPAAASHAFATAARLAATSSARCHWFTSAAACAAQAGLDEVELLDQAAACASTPQESDEITVLRCLAATWRGDAATAPAIMAAEGPAMVERSPVTAGIGYACSSGAAFQDLDLTTMRECAHLNPLRDADVNDLLGPAALVAVNTGFVEAVLSNVDDAAKRLQRCAVALSTAEVVDAATPCVYALGWLEEFDAARQLLDSALQIAQQTGSIATVAWLLAADGYLEMTAGRLGAASARTKQALELAGATESTFTLATCHAQLAWVCAVRGDRSAVVFHCANADGNNQARAHANHARGLLELGNGHADSALPHLLAAWEPIRSPDFNPIVVPVIGDLAESAIRCRNRSVAQHVTNQLDRATAAIGSRWLHLVAARIRVLGSARDSIDSAIAIAEAAIEAHPSSFERARTLLVIGERLRRLKRRGEARSRLERAAELFEAIGARPWHERATIEFVAAGGSRPGPADDTQGQFAALTPREWQVAMAVAKGASNAQAAQELFLSLKTIEGHLSAVFRKTGVSSRSELVRRVHEQPELRQSRVAIHAPVSSPHAGPAQ